MKLVINRCFGGFGLSHAAMLDYAKRCGFDLFAYVNARSADGRIDFDTLVPWTEGNKDSCIHYSRKPIGKNGKITEKSYLSNYDIKRDDPNLVATVETLGPKADGFCSKLSIVEIPDGVQWEIDEYDGQESVHEVHRSWS